MSALAGKKIVITRAMHQAAEFENLLHKREADVLLYPCIDIVPLEDASVLDAALCAIATFDWLVLTSTNTVYILRQKFDELTIAASALSRLQVAAVGSATANAAYAWLGLNVNVMPEDYTAEALAKAIPLAKGARILLPQSAIAEPALANELSQAGSTVTAIPTYRTIIGSGGVDLSALLNSGNVDVITFTSSSTVTNCLQRLKAEGGDISTLMKICIACIGPKTAATARQNELPVTVMPDEHTLDGLIAALENYFAAS
jgi:uroporphyrinogen-III synthase